MPQYLVNFVSPAPKRSPTILSSISPLMLNVYCEVHSFKATADLSQALVIQILSHTLVTYRRLLPSVGLIVSQDVPRSLFKRMELETKNPLLLVRDPVNVALAWSIGVTLRERLFV